MKTLRGLCLFVAACLKRSNDVPTFKNLRKETSGTYKKTTTSLCEKAARRGASPAGFLALFVLVTAFCVTVDARGALTESQARTQARRLWGVFGTVGRVSIQGTTSWMYQVGFDSPGCYKDFTVLGEAPGNWEAAFAAVKPDAIRGPYSNDVRLISVAADDAGVVAYQWLVDGLPRIPEIVFPGPLQYVVLNNGFDTRSVPNGLHVVCGIARDAAGNKGKTFAVLVMVDQTKPSASATIEILNKSGGTSPSVRRNLPIL